MARLAPQLALLLAAVAVTDDAEGGGGRSRAALRARSAGGRARRTVAVGLALLLTGCACDEAVAGGRTPEPPTCIASPEVCNGRDDDCDGAIDEELPPLRCGLGGCAREVPACDLGVPAECVQGSPATERCDGLDDDCDGSADEELPIASCGLGACERAAASCLAPQDCAPGLPTPERCANGTDDDCDGAEDCFDRDCFDPRTIASLRPPFAGLGGDGLPVRGLPSPGGGYVVVLPDGTAGDRFALQLARIDEEGVLLGPPVELADSAGVSSFALLPAPDGFQLLLTLTGPALEVIVQHRRLDAEGNELGTVALDPTVPGATLGQLVAAPDREGGAIVALALRDVATGATTLQLARLDADGAFVSPWTPLPATYPAPPSIVLESDGTDASLLIEAREPAGRWRATVQVIAAGGADAGPAVELWADGTGTDAPALLPLHDGTIAVARTVERPDGRRVELSRRDGAGETLVSVELRGADTPSASGPSLGWRGADVLLFHRGSWGGLAWSTFTPALEPLEPSVRATTGGCPEVGALLPGGARPRALLSFGCREDERVAAFFDADVCAR